MSGSREESPDWLRNFQAPTHSIMTLSSESGSSTDDTADGQTLSQFLKPRGSGNGDDGKFKEQVTSDKLAPKSSIWSLSSDSESCPDNSLKKEEKTSKFQGHQEDEDAALIVHKGKSPCKKASKEKSPKRGLKVTDHMQKIEKDIDDNLDQEGNEGPEDVEEDAADKRNKTTVSTSVLPLVLSEKVQRTKALVECDGESIDLSGDMGAVGRVVVQDTPNGDHEMSFDLKGTIYKTTIVPSRTFCIVSFGQSEAKIEAIMNDFIQLKPQSNVYEAETMVEGTLDGFSFDSEDDADKIAKATSHQTDQNDGIEEQTNGKTNAKAEKSSGVKRKRGTSGGGKQQPQKKARKKATVSKKTRAKK